MTNTTLRDVLISLTVLVMILGSVYYVVGSTIAKNDITIESEYAQMPAQFREVEAQLNKTADELRESTKEAPKTPIGQATDFFSRATKVTGSIVSTLTTASQAVSAVLASWGFSKLPPAVKYAIPLLVVMIIIMAIVSAWLRNKT